jgi:tetratricopeptide (TPR) repeat protein
MSAYFDLGTHSHPISTSSQDAQLWFDRGLNWCYGFNHEEAVTCFKRVAELDPDCAMAHWGIAYASGPFYNMPWELFGPQEAEEAVTTCHGAMARALSLKAGATAMEQALIQAIAQRFQSNQVVTAAEFGAWDDAYAAAMRDVHAAFPEDPDVITLFAEAMMTRTPWKLWDLQLGLPIPGADTLEVMKVLEEGIRLVEERGDPAHPGILHLYIHVMEMSPRPEQALRAADALRNLVPDSGHLRHMPSHIYQLCGLYYDALTVNNTAITADRKFLAIGGPADFYTTSRCHDFHLKMYAAMFLGQFRPAQEAAQGIAETVTKDLLRKDKPHMVATLEGYRSMDMHVLVRFGRWQEIIDWPLPEDPELFPVTTAMHHYAKAVAHAALGEIAAAEAEKARFEAAVARVPPQRYFFNNPAQNILAVATAMLAGELTYRKGEYETAFQHLRQAVHLDDSLAYTEPWAWMHPPRHALGALLLEQGHASEAAAVYRADLGLDDSLARPKQHPDNVWSLHGYVECLRQLERPSEAAMMAQRLARAQARCDQPITASCFCRTQKAQAVQESPEA